MLSLNFLNIHVENWNICLFFHYFIHNGFVYGNWHDKHNNNCSKILKYYNDISENGKPDNDSNVKQNFILFLSIFNKMNVV